jgi:hypothetical protein
MSALRPFETSGSDDSVPKCHIPEEIFGRSKAHRNKIVITWSRIIHFICEKVKIFEKITFKKGTEDKILLFSSEYAV